MTKLKFTFTVSNRKGTGTVKVLSDVIVRVDGKLVAFATLGGRYTPADALKEFKRAPSRFKPEGKADAAALKAYALVA